MNVDNLISKALKLQKENQLVEATNIYQDILRSNPRNADAWNLLGVIHLTKENWSEAIEHITKAINFSPGTAMLYYNLGLCYFKNNNFKAAIKNLKLVLEQDDRFIQAYTTLSLIHISEGNNYQQALQYADQALQIDLNFITAWEMRGLANEKVGNNKLAIESYQRMLDLEPSNIVGLNNLANVFINIGNLKEAELLLNKLLEINPKHADGYNNLGNIYLSRNQAFEAGRCYEQAVDLKPTLLVAKLNLANVLRANAQYTEAIPKYQDLINSNMNISGPGNLSKNYYSSKATIGLALCYANICEWEKLEQIKNNVNKIINTDLLNFKNSVIDPFEAMMLDLSQDQYIKICDRYFAKYRRFMAGQNNIKNTSASIFNNTDKLHIGYLSTDFSDGPIGFLINGIFKYHNRDKFKITGIYIGSPLSKPEQKRTAEFDDFLDLSEMSDLEAIKIINDSNIYILIDLAGYTKGCRPNILASKPAPIQAAWLGYSNSMGVKEYDYYITTPKMVSKELKNDFIESILYLPDSIISCCAFKNSLNPNQQDLSRAKYLLPEDKFIYCCFSRHYRITKELFLSWVEILKQVANSVLWLRAGDIKLDQILLEKFSKHGIESDRIIYTSPEKMSEKWHHQLADLWLDTFLLSSGTASVLCAWVGLPVLTVAGNTPQSRVASSFMHAADAIEVVVDNCQDYINKAIYFGQNPDELKNIKSSLKSNISKTALFNPQKFIHQLEQEYIKISQKYESKYREKV